ncbi:hypothetical protein OPV22_030072 [Ensete ventricosum]|uniref:Uncharacterized protein n=1 Tax=Ensete ventricosum TaxID=4639 RepID=A0AAV8PZ88_ENSVE|nr:hypothetical protein OPV22_030072 [Ensete ventricosum]
MDGVWLQHNLQLESQPVWLHSSKVNAVAIWKQRKVFLQDKVVIIFHPSRVAYSCNNVEVLMQYVESELADCLHILVSDSNAS